MLEWKGKECHFAFLFSPCSKCWIHGLVLKGSCFTDGQMSGAEAPFDVYVCTSLFFFFRDVCTFFWTHLGLPRSTRSHQHQTMSDHSGLIQLNTLGNKSCRVERHLLYLAILPSIYTASTENSDI